MAEIIKFKVGKTYSTRSACNHDCVFTFKIIKRTAKNVWVKYLTDNTVTRRKIEIWDQTESCSPFGKYSMSPIIRANR